LKVIGADNVIFASEMMGAVRGIDPESGHFYDDTVRYVEAVPLSDEERRKVFELNARRVYPRLDTRLRGRATPS
jgi:4-oxalmesaconate hydratase